MNSIIFEVIRLLYYVIILIITLALTGCSEPVIKIGSNFSDTGSSGDNSFSDSDSDSDSDDDDDDKPNDEKDDDD